MLVWVSVLLLCFRICVFVVMYFVVKGMLFVMIMLLVIVWFVIYWLVIFGFLGMMMVLIKGFCDGFRLLFDMINILVL